MFRDFRDLRDWVAERGGLADTSMEALRDLVGAGKLGVHVRDEIATGLRRQGLSVLGGRLPSDQRGVVWLYAPGTEGGAELVKALQFIALDRATRPRREGEEAA